MAATTFTTGVVNNPSEVVTAGRSRIAIAAAQCAVAAPWNPLYSSRASGAGHSIGGSGLRELYPI